MATASPSEPDTECSICHEPFILPKLIPCGHLMCRHCLISWLRSQQGAACPLCRDVIVEPQRRVSSDAEKIVDDFPTDLSMVAKVEADLLLNQNQNCCVCENMAATSLCLDCRDALCSSCVKGHRKLSSTRHHQVKDLTSLTTEELAADPSPSRCSLHNDKSCQLYCTTHGVSVCHVCATSRHRNCSEVVDLEAKAEVARAELAELAARLCAGATRLDEAIQDLDKHVQETEKKRQAVMVEIEEVCNRLDSAVQECRHHLQELEMRAFSDIKEASYNRKSCLLRRRGTLLAHKGVAQRSLGLKMRESLIEMSQKMKARVEDLDFSTDLSVDARPVSTVTLMIDPETVSFIEEALANIGQVKVVPVRLPTPSKDLLQCSDFSFHANHGRNIILSYDRHTAERTGSDLYGGVVVSCEPVIRDRLYEVRLDSRDPDSSWDMVVGVTCKPPGSKKTLPEDIFGFESVVIWYDRVDVHGKKTRTTVGQKLRNMPQGSRVGVLIDFRQCLHLYIDGQDQGVAATSLSAACFPFFDVCGCYRKISALPVSVVQ